MLGQVRSRIKTTTPEASQARERYKIFSNTMNNTRKSPQKSSIPLNATGYHDKSITSPIEALLSRIKANFGLNCQNDANFAARVGLATAQKISFLGGVG
jgi:hypothetical protein